MPDLTTRYLMLSLRNPLVVSAGPLTDHLETLPKLEEAGAAAIVLPSLFEEQIEHEEWQAHQLETFGAESFPEALDYFPEFADQRIGPDAYLRKIERAKGMVTLPVIASLNGVSAKGWTRFAGLMESAGADAIELNIYLLPTDPSHSGLDIERRYVDLVAGVREQVGIPLAVKIGPYFSSPGHLAKQLESAGADGLVLFNRFLQPDVDLETLHFVPRLELSRSAEARLAVRWIAVLREHLRLSLGANGGAHTVEDILKLLLVGADAVLLLSVLLEKGIPELGRLLAGIEQWMTEHGYDSVEQMKGSLSRAHAVNPEALDRANYMRTLESFSGLQW